LDWPGKTIQSGKNGIITIFYDSTIEPPELREKTIDIIINTNPIVEQLKSIVTIIEKE
jgi:hypothetical protein